MQVREGRAVAELYLECYSGISGDMVAGALLDVELPEPILVQQLSSIPLPDVRWEIQRVCKQGMDAVSFQATSGSSHTEQEHG